MNTKTDTATLVAKTRGATGAADRRPDYSALVTVGAVLALGFLSGCVSVPVGGRADPYHYDANTG